MIFVMKTAPHALRTRFCSTNQAFPKSPPAEFERDMRGSKQTPLKTYTSAVSAKIEGLQTRLLMEGRPFTREAVREFIYFGFTDTHYTMGYLFNAFLQSQYKKVEAGISTFKNYRKYEIVRDLLYNNSSIKEGTHLIAIRLKNIIDFNTNYRLCQDARRVDKHANKNLPLKINSHESILKASKEHFLRGFYALCQHIGRCSRLRLNRQEFLSYGPHSCKYLRHPFL